MSRMLIATACLLGPLGSYAAVVEYSWRVEQDDRDVWFSAPYPPGLGYAFTFTDIPPATGSGLLTVRARGDYTPGGDEGLPELIALDLDELYVATELDAQAQVVIDGLFGCQYPGSFPSLERGPVSPGGPLFASPPPFCLPLAGPDAGATILAIHDGIGQDVEWEQAFFLDAAGLRALTADGALRIDASTLDANFFPDQVAVPPYFEFRLSYEVSEPGSMALLGLGLVGFATVAYRRRPLARAS